MAQPIPVKITGYGTTLVSAVPGADDSSVVRATFEQMLRADGHHDQATIDGELVTARWRLDLYPGEALALIAALADSLRKLIP